MSQHTERTVLNRLIEICRDGERGFQAAAERVSDPELKSLFTSLADERRQFAAALIPHAQRLGGDPAAEGTTIARLHRGWITVKSRVTGHHEHSILNEVERGEDAAVHAYRDALNEVLAPAARELVERQCAAIDEAHEHIRGLASGVVNPPV